MNNCFNFGFFSPRNSFFKSSIAFCCCRLVLLLFAFLVPLCHYCGAIIHHHHHHLHYPKSSSSAASAKSPEIRYMQQLFHRVERGDAIGGSSAIGYTPTVSVKKCDGIAAAGDGQNGHRSSSVGDGTAPLGWGLKFALNKLAPTERYVRAELHLHGRLESFLDVPAKTATKTLRIVQSVCSNNNEWIKKIDNGKFAQNWTTTSTDAGDEGSIWPSRHIPLWIRQIEDYVLRVEDTDKYRSRAGWTMFDTMIPLLYASMDEHNELHFSLYRYRKALDEEHPLKRFVHNHHPFLVVYTEAMMSTKNIAAGDKLKQEHRHKRDILATMTGHGRQPEDVRHHMETVRKTAEYFSYGMAKGNVDDDAVGQKAVDGNAVAMDTLRRLNRRQKLRKRKSKSKQKKIGFDPNDPMLGFGTPYSPWQRMTPTKLLQSLNGGGRTAPNDIRGLRQRGYWIGSGIRDGNGTNNGVHNDETKLFIMEEEKSTKKSEGRCAWHNMTVDLRELGWSDRIIAPKTFEAGFCGGHCDYPLENESNPSNHAILQSLIVAAATQQRQRRQPAEVQAVQAATQPAAVCCAPAQYDSLTLLYFDEWDNVVLKNYPRMVVFSCGCI